MNPALQSGSQTSMTQLFLTAFFSTKLDGAKATAKKMLGGSRKGQMSGVDSLGPLALGVVSLAIIVGIGSIVLAEMNTAVNNSDAESVLNTGIDALGTFSDFFTVIVVIGVAAVLFLLLRAVRGAGKMASA